MRRAVAQVSAQTLWPCAEMHLSLAKRHASLTNVISLTAEQVSRSHEPGKHAQSRQPMHTAENMMRMMWQKAGPH